MATAKAQPGARTELASALPLGLAVLQLRQIQSAVVVAVAALRQQNCELDEDVAKVLQRSVADRLEEQIQLLDRMDRGLPKRSMKGRRAESLDPSAIMGNPAARPVKG